MTDVSPAPPERSYNFESVSWDDPRAVTLRAAMDVEMIARYTTPDGPGLSDAARCALSVDPAQMVATELVVDAAGTALAHGALRLLRGEWEVKRVIVAIGRRGGGIGRALMVRLERIAVQGGASRLILQTGNRQPDAVALYERLGYTPIPIYEPYGAVDFSLCFEKSVR